MHIGKNQRRQRNVHEEPVQRDGVIVWEPPGTAKDDAEEEARPEHKVVVQYRPPPIAFSRAMSAVYEPIRGVGTSIAGAHRLAVGCGYDHAGRDAG